MACQAGLASIGERLVSRQDVCVRWRTDYRFAEADYSCPASSLVERLFLGMQ